MLGASGHIAGVINPASKNRRNYWTNELLTDDADDWLARAESRPGSWWPHWAAWLAEHGGTRHPAPAKEGNARHPPLGAAPGTLRHGTRRLSAFAARSRTRPNVRSLRYHNAITRPRRRARGFAPHP